MSLGHRVAADSTLGYQNERYVFFCGNQARYTDNSLEPHMFLHLWLHPFPITLLSPHSLGTKLAPDFLFENTL